jgi:flagellar hook-associated protein 2
MANASIGGLVSGLDTATIISQLMQLEARPQTMLQSRVTTAERQVTSLQTVNSKLAAIATKAAELADLDKWSPMKASSTHDAVTVAADSTATPTTLSFTVDQAATTSRRSYITTGTAEAALVTPNTELTITHVAKDADGLNKTATIKTGDGSLTAIAAAINDPENATGLRATLIKVAGAGESATYQLHVVSTATGAESGFEIGDGAFLGGIAGQADGSNALISFNGVEIEFASNTFDDLMPGVDVTIASDIEIDPASPPSATITIAKDEAALATKVQGLVDAINSALSDIDSLTAYGKDGKGGGLLAGDSMLRGVRSQLLSSVTAGVNGESLATYGIETTREGKLTFDEAKFKEAFAANPNKTAAMFTASEDAAVAGGFASSLEKLADSFSDSIDGTVTQTIKSRQSTIDGWEDDIADWDVRLDQRRTTLERQYAQLEVALGQLQSQGNWLAGQLAGLPSWNSGQ